MKSCLILLLMALIAPGIMAQEAPPYVLVSSLVGGTGGFGESESYGLEFTVGQLTAGESSSPEYSNSSGFWEGATLVSTTFSPTIAMDAQWNMISVPVIVESGDKDFLFPTASSSAFTYSIPVGYLVQDTIRHRKGYWLRFPSPQSVTIVGLPIEEDTLDIAAGWNMIGSISYPVATSSISSVPAGMRLSNFFGYQRGYYIADTIRPGKGYWVKTDQPGRLVLSTSNAQAAKSLIQIVAIEGFPPPPPSETASPDIHLPKEFALWQNYPNPFNPSTKISYDLPAGALVTLRVYDILGRQLVSLAEEKVHQPGRHTLVFDAAAYPSGMYVYRMTAVMNGNVHTDVRTMLLLR